uniref:Single-stranded DNA-binding protein n=1 Tax=Chromera velia CCMP2878 TaxID=1169474 RepID=A0A0G4FPY3_9ALVE|eukprot:Cvel_18072.t1-p1 / transcript=Cvel_18072.t1 / gene=Cvel_18072 / organism=Chromera_velia_CCMP2878 / gene_product=Single-stranded DNA-binding protein, putative / transcript_product=Single-stranded DNA-binding protein, putative / location=Cvel_scaffold1478:10701-13997(-) / protein_length=292 / sequence_SO=supercontig / SO=protein_coding / is_pseudo=false
MTGPPLLWAGLALCALTCVHGFSFTLLAQRPSPFLSPRTSRLRSFYGDFEGTEERETGRVREPGTKLFMSERSLNKVTLMGRLGQDPDVRVMSSGERMASLNLATSETWKDKSTGDVRSKTEWHRVVVFDQALVDIVEKYARKGKKLYVEGSLQTRKWVGQDGTERFSTEVVLPKYRGELILLDKADVPPSSSTGGAGDTSSFYGGATQGASAYESLGGTATSAGGGFGVQSSMQMNSVPPSSSAPYGAVTGRGAPGGGSFSPAQAKGSAGGYGYGKGIYGAAASGQGQRRR